MPNDILIITKFQNGKKQIIITINIAQEVDSYGILDNKSETKNLRT